MEFACFSAYAADGAVLSVDFNFKLFAIYSAYIETALRRRRAASPPTKPVIILCVNALRK